jgi:hypothetical protein
MRRQLPIQALSAALALALFVGCSSGSTMTPKLASPQVSSHLVAWQVPSALSIVTHSGHRFVSYFSCSATGPLKYVSDYHNNVINIYEGVFHGQKPCGQITSGLLQPWGLYVKRETHDLYVANLAGADIVVFHRGQLTPYNTYNNPNGLSPEDVTIANDGTVIASDFEGPGYVSTWISGPNGGTFVGNYPMTNSANGLFVTVKKNGTVYYNDIDLSTSQGALWSLSCPAGVCGAQTRVAGITFVYPGGMAIDAEGDLVVTDTDRGRANTFELPNPNPKFFGLEYLPFGMAINELDHHYLIADFTYDNAVEYSYPSGKLIGKVPGNKGGGIVGIAVDP